MNDRQQEIYGSMHEDTWIIQKDLLEILKIKYKRDYKPRALRQIVKECRMLYKEDKLPMLIIKSNKGYKLSNDYKEIYRFAKELMATGDSMKREGMELMRAAENHSSAEKEKEPVSNCLAIEDYSHDTINEMIRQGCFDHLQLIEITKCILGSIPYVDILMLANPAMHPYIMFLVRKGLLEDMDRKVISLYADVTLTTGNAYKLYHAASSGCSIDKIMKMKKEMRDVESKKTDQG